MGQFFSTILINPLLNALIWLYDVIPGHDMGVAIILLTLVIKIVLFLPSLSSIKSQHQLQSIQPKVDAIRKKYASSKDIMGQKLMELYKENKVNPFSSCLPLLIQLPIIWALFRVFMDIQKVDAAGVLTPDIAHSLYGWLQAKYTTLPIDKMFLGFVDLSATKNYILAVLAGGLSFLQAWMMQSRKPAVKTEGAKDENIAAAMTKNTMYLLPIMTVFFGISFPAGVTLYWVASTAFTIIQQWYFIRRHKSPTVEQEMNKV